MKNYNYLASELCKFGLNKKEAEIYLVLLEMGYCSVQEIAKKVDLSRPTVYRNLEKLKKRSLINTAQKGKRNYFVAGSPDAFLNIIKIKKRQAEEQEREFLRIINTLQNQYSFNSEENIIEIYDQNQKSLVLQKLSTAQVSEIKFIQTKNDLELEKVLKEVGEKMGSNFKIQKITTLKKNIRKKFFITKKKIESTSKFKNKNIVIADKIFVFEKNKISVIKNPNIIKTFNLVFDLISAKSIN